jgi:hypothetical protein
MSYHSRFHPGQTLLTIDLLIRPCGLRIVVRNRGLVLKEMRSAEALRETLPTACQVHPNDSASSQTCAQGRFSSHRIRGPTRLTWSRRREPICIVLATRQIDSLSELSRWRYDTGDAHAHRTKPLLSFVMVAPCCLGSRIGSETLDVVPDLDEEWMGTWSCTKMKTGNGWKIKKSRVMMAPT